MSNKLRVWEEFHRHNNTKLSQPGLLELFFALWSIEAAQTLASPLFPHPSSSCLAFASFAMKNNWSTFYTDWQFIRDKMIFSVFRHGIPGILLLKRGVLASLAHELLRRSMPRDALRRGRRDQCQRFAKNGGFPSPFPVVWMRDRGKKVVTGDHVVIYDDINYYSGRRDVVTALSSATFCYP